MRKHRTQNKRRPYRDDERNTTKKKKRKRRKKGVRTPSARPMKTKTHRVVYSSQRGYG
jgi:hypothetical protein